MHNFEQAKNGANSQSVSLNQPDRRIIMTRNLIIIISLLTTNLLGQNKLPKYYSKEAQNTIDSLKEKGVGKILTYYRDKRKEGLELVDRETDEKVNHIYIYIIWQDSLGLGLNIIKFKDTKKFNGWLYCSYFQDIFDNYEKLKAEKDNAKKPLNLNYGDSYPFSNITLFEAGKFISFDLINEIKHANHLSLRQFYFYNIQFCLLDLENESNWR